MNKKGFGFHLQNIPSVNFAGFLAKQTMADWTNGGLLESWQSAYWMKHKKSGREPERPGPEESVDENETVMAQEPSPEEEAAEGEKDLRLNHPSGERGDGLTEKELQKAIAMSVILGPPACRKRKRHESTIGRR